MVIVLTLVLFVIALFVKGFSHELLQECGVFLVSVKLIMMSHKNGVSARRAEERLARSRICCNAAGGYLICTAYPANTSASNLLRAVVLHFLVC